MTRPRPSPHNLQGACAADKFQTIFSSAIFNGSIPTYFAPYLTFESVKTGLVYVNDAEQTGQVSSGGVTVNKGWHEVSPKSPCVQKTLGSTQSLLAFPQLGHADHALPRIRRLWRTTGSDSWLRRKPSETALSLRTSYVTLPRPQGLPEQTVCTASIGIASDPGRDLLQPPNLPAAPRHQKLTETRSEGEFASLPLRPGQAPVFSLAGVLQPPRHSWLWLAGWVRAPLPPRRRSSCDT